MKLQIFLPLLTLCSVGGLRILSVIPSAVKSHYISCRRILTELDRLGHEVVSVSSYEEKNVSKNFTWIQIEVTSFVEAVPELIEEMKKELSYIESQKRLRRTVNKYTRYITKLDKFKQFINNDNSSFDVVLIEEFFQPIYYLFAHKYKAPLIIFSSFGPAHYISEVMGNPLELSYVPNEFLDYFGDMSFYERIRNGFLTLVDLYNRRWYSLDVQNEIAKEVFKGDVPSLYEMEDKISLVLLNSHVSMMVVRPYLPNIIEVGGTHIEDVKPLSRNLQVVLDGATDGVILLSFGSIMDLSMQTDDVVIKILNAIGNLKQRILLKWNSKKKLPIQYDNIYPFEWLPQNDVLAHPHTVLFITHGGLLSSQESVYHGVPNICIPFFGDQPLNCQRTVKLGYGINLDLNTLTTEVLRGSIENILSDDNYKNNVMKLSSRFRDRPMSPLQTATFWIEYCARHNGAGFLKGPRKNLHFFQYVYLDVLVVFLIITFIIYKLLKLLSKLFKRKIKIN